MSARDLLVRLDELGITLAREGASLRFSGPKGALDEVLRGQIRDSKEQLLALLGSEHDASSRIARRGAPASTSAQRFAMSAIQQAYWIGEQGLYANCCVPYLYNEYRVGQLDLDSLVRAIEALVARHSALRLHFHDDGLQEIVARAPYAPAVVDLRASSIAPAAAMAAHRSELERRLAASPWPFEFVIHRFNDSDIVSFTFRLIVVDGVSFNLLISELMARYHGAPAAAEAAPYSYYDYIAYLAARKGTRQYRLAERYWDQRLPALPGAPKLPLLDHAAGNDETPFTRLSVRLDRARWQRLAAIAQANGVPVNSVLCAIYCDVLARWSSSPDFTLNILLSDRPVHLPGMDKLIGNCSTTLLLEVHHRAGSFLERALAVRDQLFSDMEHHAVPGVDLIRRLQAQQGADGVAPLPVVFTSAVGLGDGLEGFTIRDPHWQLLHSHLKTPQVSLDHQVYEDDGELVLNWDYVPTMYPDGVVEAMFASYQEWITTLSTHAHAWTQLRGAAVPEAQLQLRKGFNMQPAPLPVQLLHEGFVQMACARPGHAAVICEQGTTSYQALHARALRIAQEIAGVLPRGANHVIGIHARKGRDQIAAVLAVLISGNTYLPIDSKLPASRVETILVHSQARLVLADGHCAAVFDAIAAPQYLVLEHIAASPVAGGLAPPAPARAPEERAYIIYTSGSTGQPKGVVITHLAAMNTLEDMVRRFGLSGNDTVLGLSALNFDLSVYDIFATLSCGATLLLPPDQAIPDPRAWLDLMRRHPVTVWNSVPALMEMTLEYLRGDAAPLAHLRVVFFSGDWIALKLVSTMQQRCAHARLIALGGATEASIWSNYYPIAQMPPGWNSVPYGTPLRNQAMLVLDKDLNEVPDWVSGDLYIAGVGLAEGYLNDEAKTGASFIFHPVSGARMYRSGDLARVRDGLIEFLGRADYQIKIRGYRVELGDLEACICRLDGVDAAVALLDGRNSAEQRLVLFYTTATGAALSASRINAYLSAQLPHYMVPSQLIFLEQLPLSANAKIDRKALLASMADHGGTRSGTHVAPSTDTEWRVAAIWQDMLGTDIHDVNTSFFQLGGNSLLVIRLANQIRSAFNVSLPLNTFFQRQSVSALAAELERTQASDASPLILLSDNDDSDRLLFLVHPVGGHVLCYRPVAYLLPHFSLYGIQAAHPRARGDAPDSIEDMASGYADAIVGAAGNRQIHLGGWSMGAVLALAIARELEARGCQLAPLLLIDPWSADRHTHADFSDAIAVRGFFSDILRDDAPLAPPAPGECVEHYLARCHADLQDQVQSFPLALDEVQELFTLYRHNSLLLRRHQALPPLAPLLIAEASQRGDGFVGLRPLAAADAGRPTGFEHATRLTIDASHWSIMEAVHLHALVLRWRILIERADTAGATPNLAPCKCTSNS